MPKAKGARRRRAGAFDYWRRRLEESDVLVFVISGPHWSVELSGEMRGFAIAMPELPVLVVNGKDYSQGARRSLSSMSYAMSCWAKAQFRTVPAMILS